MNILTLVLWMSLRKTACRHSHQYYNLLKKLQKNFCWQTWWKESSWEMKMCMGGWYYVSWVHGVSWCEMDSASWGQRPVADSHKNDSEPTVYVTGGELHDLLKNYQLLTAAWSTRSSTKVMSPIFISETTLVITIKFTYIIGTCLTNFRILLHSVSLIINTLFPPFYETLCFSSLSSAKWHPWSAFFKKPNSGNGGC